VSIKHRRRVSCSMRWPKAVVAATLGALFVVSVGLGMSAAPASATALGCSYNVGGIQTYCELVNGSGDYVASVEGSFASTSPICNWDVTAEFFNSNNQWYRTTKSAVHYNCSYVNHDWAPVGFWAQTGYVCSTLQQNGSRIISRCEAIHP